MKCKNCDGDGVIVDVEYGHAGKYGCKYCDGKGVVEPLTEQEYIQTCNTEQLADVLADVSLWIHPFMKQKNRFELLKKQFYEWLKQPHTRSDKNAE